MCRHARLSSACFFCVSALFLPTLRHTSVPRAPGRISGFLEATYIVSRSWGQEKRTCGLSRPVFQTWGEVAIKEGRGLGEKRGHWTRGLGGRGRGPLACIANKQGMALLSMERNLLRVFPPREQSNPLPSFIKKPDDWQLDP